MEDISKIKWFHSIDLGNGIVTQGFDQNQKRLSTLHLPEDLTGKSFLDIGAWDGFFSFEAERRGAKRVLATDSLVWEGQTWGSKQGFETARRILKSHVEDLNIDLFDMSPEQIGMWDVVLLAGVLYHTKHPLLALERAASVTKELLIVETVIDKRFSRRPAVAFYSGNELAEDPTNWCAPNVPALQSMLRACGFQYVRVVYKTPLLRQLRATVSWMLRSGTSPLTTLQQGRAVVHARH